MSIVAGPGARAVTSVTAGGGARAATYGYAADAAGNGLFLAPSSGGPKFTPTISGPATSSVATGATTTLTYAAANTGAPTTPVSYNWTVTGGGGAVSDAIVNGQGTASINLRLTGNSAGNSALTINCAATDAAGVVENATFSLAATATASSGGGGGGTTPYSVAISPTGDNLGNVVVGHTNHETLQAVFEQGSSPLNTPITCAWSYALTGNGVSIALSSASGQQITLSETGTNVGNATQCAVTVVATDAGGVQATAKYNFGVATTAS